MHIKGKPIHIYMILSIIVFGIYLLYLLVIYSISVSISEIEVTSDARLITILSLTIALFQCLFLYFLSKKSILDSYEDPRIKFILFLCLLSSMMIANSKSLKIINEKFSDEKISIIKGSIEEKYKIQRKNSVSYRLKVRMPDSSYTVISLQKKQYKLAKVTGDFFACYTIGFLGISYKFNSKKTMKNTSLTEKCNTENNHFSDPEKLKKIEFDSFILTKKDINLARKRIAREIDVSKYPVTSKIYISFSASKMDHVILFDKNGMLIYSGLIKKGESIELYLRLPVLFWTQSRGIISHFKINNKNVDFYEKENTKSHYFLVK